MIKGPAVTIRFVSDEIVTDKGFELEYFVCK